MVEEDEEAGMIEGPEPDPAWICDSDAVLDALPGSIEVDVECVCAGAESISDRCCWP